MRWKVRRARRDWGETSACEDRQTADSFGVFEDISNLSIKLLRGSRRRMHSPSSAVFVRTLLFRSFQISLFSPSKRKILCSKWYSTAKQNKEKDFKWYLVLLKEFPRSLKIILLKQTSELSR